MVEFSPLLQEEKNEHHKYVFAFRRESRTEVESGIIPFDHIYTQRYYYWFKQYSIHFKSESNCPEVLDYFKDSKILTTLQHSSMLNVIISLSLKVLLLIKITDVILFTAFISSIKSQVFVY